MLRILVPSAALRRPLRQTLETMKKHLRPNPHTVSEPISVTLNDGTVVTGTLWLHPSRVGSFEVEYQGMRNTDGRTDYSSTAHLRGIASAILKEMADGKK